MLRRQIQLLAIAVIALLAAPINPAPACTGIRVRPQDGSVISARTLEFGTDLHSTLVVIPRNLQYKGTAPGGKPGLKWSTRFGMVGTNALGLPHICDGLNEKGLGMGLFYFHTYDDRQVRMVDLKGVDLDSGKIVTIPMSGATTFEDVTGRLSGGISGIETSATIKRQ